MTVPHGNEPPPAQSDDPQGDNAQRDEEPLYRFSWRRFAVIGIALLTLPIWAPWVQRNVGLREMLLMIPFVAIFGVSIWFITFMFPSRSIRQREKRKRW